MTTRSISIFVLIFASIAAISLDLEAATILFEDFEDSTILYTADDAEATNGNFAYFGRIGGTGGFSNTSGGYLSPPSGTGFFAAEDVDQDPGPNISDKEGTIRFQNINIAGMTDIKFSAYFASDGGGSFWDLTDYLHVTYSIDSGAEQNLFWLEEGPSTAKSSVDTDFDGLGDGENISNTFKKMADNVSISGTGDSLELIFRMRTDTSNEGMGFDDVTITATAVPEPHEYAFAATLLLIGFTAWRRGSQLAPTCN